MKTTIITLAALLSALPAAHARQGGRDGGVSGGGAIDGGGGTARPETIRCALYFTGDTAAQGETSALVENASALLRGSASGVDYVFSVRGKTAVARLVSKDSGFTASAQGAIEMLRHGGGAKALLSENLIARRGGDDDQDGNPEREAGFELSLAQPGGSAGNNVKLKCESTNTHEVQ